MILNFRRFESYLYSILYAFSKFTPAHFIKSLAFIRIGRIFITFRQQNYNYSFSQRTKMPASELGDKCPNPTHDLSVAYYCPKCFHETGQFKFLHVLSCEDHGCVVDPDAATGVNILCISCHTKIVDKSSSSSTKASSSSSSPHETKKSSKAKQAAKTAKKRSQLTVKETNTRKALKATFDNKASKKYYPIGSDIQQIVKTK